MGKKQMSGSVEAESGKANRKVKFRDSLVTRVTAAETLIFCVMNLCLLVIFLILNTSHHYRKDTQVMQAYLTSAQKSVDNLLKDMSRARGAAPGERADSIEITTPLPAVQEELKRYLYEESGYLLLSPDQIIVSCENPERIGQSIDTLAPKLPERITQEAGAFITKFEGVRYLVTYQTSEYSGMTLFTAKTMLSIFAEIKPLLLFYMVLFWIFAGITLFVVWAITKGRLREITMLSSELSGFQRDSLKKRYPIKRWDEIGQLKQSFNDTMDWLDELVALEYEGKMKLQQAQITEQQLAVMYLKSQINPHFLYNTLDMIRMKAALEGDEAVAELLMQLVVFYRLSTKMDQHLIPLHEEMTMVEAYMKLICCRYPHLKFECRMEDGLEDIVVPSFILQPLLENSILHGLKNKGYQGRIRLEICIDQRRRELIHVYIEDDGAGMDEATRQRLNRQMEESQEVLLAAGKGRRIGVANVQMRVKLFYDAECGVYFENNKAGGVTVSMFLKREVVNKDILK